MNSDRFVVIGLARVRCSWFAEVARWANSAVLPLEFLKCVSATEVASRIASGRAFSALLLDAAAAGVDRDLIDSARTDGIAVIIVQDPRIDRNWVDLGAVEVLTDQFTRADLLDALTTFAAPIDRTATAVSALATVVPNTEQSWKGALIGVCGERGGGSSTTAMALASGLGVIPGYEANVLLADLALSADQAMFHHVRDIVPGIQEMCELHRGTSPTPGAIRELTFDINKRGYLLLLGLRTHRDWVVLRPQALRAAITSLTHTFRYTVADITGEFDGEEETASVDMEERNGPARFVCAEADLILICGSASLKGVRSIVNCRNDALRHGAEAARILPVITRAPRTRRARAEILAALEEFSRAEDALPPVFLPTIRGMEAIHAVAGPLPKQLISSITQPVCALLGNAEVEAKRAEHRGERLAPGSLNIGQSAAG